MNKKSEDCCGHYHIYKELLECIFTCEVTIEIHLFIYIVCIYVFIYFFVFERCLNTSIKYYISFYHEDATYYEIEDFRLAIRSHCLLSICNFHLYSILVLRAGFGF